MNELILNDLVHWIKEREKAREGKVKGLPKPWTEDKIIQSYRFCNVHREDDYVTKWFAANWRNEKYWEEPNFVPAIIFGRTINWPKTLEIVGFPDTWDKSGVCKVLDSIQARGDKTYTGAYMITAGPPGVRKNLWVTDNADYYFKKPPRIKSDSLEESWKEILRNGYPCVGPFIAGQVIADLKYTDWLDNANDWWDWAAVGPGSSKGLNRLFNRKLSGEVPQDQAVKEMLKVRDAIEPKISMSLHLQDIQNCLCELDKFERVKLGQGKPRSGYNGRG